MKDFKELNDEELNMRINSFLTRKHEQFPELRLRKEKHHLPDTHSMIDTFLGTIAGIKLQLNR